MMSSMRGSPATGRAPRRGKSKIPGLQYLAIAGIGLVVLVAALLLVGGRSKEAPKPKAARAQKSGTSTRASRRAKASAVSQKSERPSRERRRQERLGRAGREREQRAERRPRRSRDGSYRTASRGANYSPNTLRAIVTDNAGSRLAIVGERRLRAGDEVEGRKITEVGTDQIKVQFRQSEYTVRVGAPLY